MTLLEMQPCFFSTEMYGEYRPVRVLHPLETKEPNTIKSEGNVRCSQAGDSFLGHEPV